MKFLMRKPSKHLPKISKSSYSGDAWEGLEPTHKTAQMEMKKWEECKKD